MSIILSKTNEISEKPMAKAYFEYLDENMVNPDILHIESDLGLAILKLDALTIQGKYPTQFIDVGIQEANAVGVACGMSAKGFIPFVHSFGTFITRRVFDQVFISGAYAGANIKLIGSDPGIMAAFNGGTHMPFEDVALMRSIPEMTIVEPSDAVIAKALFKAAADTYGMFYIRFMRKEAATLYEDGSVFTVGKGNVIKDGGDVTIIACGAMVEESLQAVELLKQEGIEARLVDMFTIKPLDDELVIKCARETGAVVTAENHNIIGGLGSAVAETLSESCPVPLGRIGARDCFGQVGDVGYLKEVYGMAATDIAAKAKEVIAKK
ncbi:MAG: transketolase family protein [Clostridiales Family XIII bacterium]|jgi:transketolase|nr:transketolase family protein [Clostridiales Family XIII bacterium]